MGSCDVVFVVDASQSKESNFALALNFAAVVVQQYAPYTSANGMGWV